jgi:ABC-2 type transport system ATP-binding protein
VNDAIELRGVSKTFGRVEAVVDLDLRVPEGSLFGLIGPNGAGKTTAFGMMCGFLRPSRGEVRVRGHHLRPGRAPVGLVLALPQDAALPPERRAVDVLVSLGRLGGLRPGDAERKARLALEQVGLADRAEHRVGALSHGQRRRVGIAQCLVGHEEVILLDEPTAGLDPRTALELGALVAGLARERTIVLSSHNLSEVESLCTHAAILDRGRLVSVGPMGELRGTGHHLSIRLARALDSTAEALARIGALGGVLGVEVAEDGAVLRVAIRDAALADAVTGEALRLLLDLGALVVGVERGQRLEQRFLEVTGGGPR